MNNAHSFVCNYLIENPGEGPAQEVEGIGGGVNAAPAPVAAHLYLPDEGEARPGDAHVAQAHGGAPLVGIRPERRGDGPFVFM